MFSILHCADLHLEASFAAGRVPPAMGNWRRADLQATLGRILAMAREQQADAVTIAGDLYEHEYAMPDTAEQLCETLAGVAPVRVFIAPGERDPFDDDSLYALTVWPENVTIMPPGKLSRYELAPGLWLWGAGYARGAHSDILDGFRVEGEGTHILLLHAAQGDPGTEGPFWVEGRGLRKAGFHLALLGHEHSGWSRTEGNVRCLYPGSPEPLLADEAGGDHLAVLVTVENGSCTPRGLPISRWRYPDLRVDLSGSSSLEEAAALVRVALREAGAVDECSTCRVALVGNRRFDLDLEALRGLVETTADLHYAAGPSSPLGLEQLAQEATMRGQFVRRLQARMAGASQSEQALLLRALNLGLRALEGKQVQSYESG